MACPVRLVVLLLLLSASALLAAPDAQTGPVPLPTSGTEETNSQDFQGVLLQIQEQLHGNQLAIEQNRQEAQAAAARTANALADRMQSIEDSLAAQRGRELETIQSSSRMMLMVAGTFATIGFIAMLLMAYFQWRAVNRLAEISTALPALRPLGLAPALPALGPGNTQPGAADAPEQSNQRLLGTIERLEKRMDELEHTAHIPLQVPASAGNGNGHPPLSEEEAHLTMLLAKGQSLLNLDQAQDALACFEEALALHPDHAEALVKKGTALERLQKLDEAIDCYDQAIAADGSMTVAYLHKGGLFNRLERFNEALQCYEQALRTQEKQADNTAPSAVPMQQTENPG